mgnify:CR=1 FL=1
MLSISSTDADETAYILDYVPRLVGAVVATIACGAVLVSIDLPLGLIVLIGVPVVVTGLLTSAISGGTVSANALTSTTLWGGTLATSADTSAVAS